MEEDIDGVKALAMSFAIAEKGLEKIWRHRRHCSGIKKNRGCVSFDFKLPFKSSIYLR